MLKSLFTLLFVSIVSASAFSQDVSFTFGPKVGINFSSLNHVGDGLSSSSKVGYTAGGFARVRVSHFFIQPEVYYNYLNSDVSGTTTSGGVTTNVNLTVKSNDLVIPVLLGAIVGEDKLNFRVYAAPLISFNLSNSGYTGIDNIKTANYNNSQWGGLVGIGVDLANITLDARYQAQFTAATDGDNNSITGQVKNSQFQFAVGFKIL